MEDNKKKRWRPSLTDYRKLEKELSEVKENYRLQLVAAKNLVRDMKELKKEMAIAVEDNPVYRELKTKFEEQIDGTSMLVADCDGWREKYRELEEKYNEQIEGTSMLVSDCDGWRKKFRDLISKYQNDKTHFIHGEQAVKDEYELRLKYQSERDLLEKSNKLMENELKKQREINNELNKMNASLRKENKFLKSRNFWERISNKKYVADE